MMMMIIIITTEYYTNNCLLALVIPSIFASEHICLGICSSLRIQFCIQMHPVQKNSVAFNLINVVPLFSLLILYYDPEKDTTKTLAPTDRLFLPFFVTQN